MASNNSIETGIALEVYIGELANMKKINDTSAKLFGLGLINERRFLNTLAGMIWVDVKRMYKGFVNSPKSWSNRTYNLHDAYCCFMIASDENGVLKKDYTNWFWKPSPKAMGGNKSMNYTAFTKENNNFRVSSKPSEKRFYSSKIDFGKPMYIHSFEAKGDNSWRKRKKVFVDRPMNVLGTQCADRLFKNYRPIHNKGITIVFANAIYYSMFLENAMGSGKKKRISKDVVSSFMTMASEIVTTYGDQSQSGVQVYFRKQIYNYRGVGKNLSVFSHGYPA